VGVLVSGGDGLGLASVGLMLVLCMFVRMSVDRAVGMAMLVLVLRMDVRMRVHEPIGMLMFVGVF